MEKKDRINKIQEAPPGSIFIVRAPNGLFWKIRDRGYTEDIQEARKWTKEEIIEKLEANGFMDKHIDVYTPTDSI